MLNIAIGLRDLSGCGTLKEVSEDVWSHAHIKIDRRKIKFGDEPVGNADDLLGAGSQCCFFMTGQGASESFYCGKIIRVLPASLGEQERFRIEFSLVNKTIKASEIENFEGLTRGQHHVYY